MFDEMLSRDLTQKPSLGLEQMPTAETFPVRQSNQSTASATITALEKMRERDPALFTRTLSRLIRLSDKRFSCELMEAFPGLK